ncbi:protamine P1 family protein [Abeliophyllum distichum]|uniref:Protamine P1 family protein n=1 Tax=Abeliophyllum distichum TaxID=126358 RepID=A0ABD1QZ11_9LAMI
MKALSKPISSPSRGEKFPPPLMMRFLRSNVGSRSRGRLRSSPMFYLRTKKNVIETTQEPSSPKVTCIGQVRVRRSSKSKTKTTPKKGRATTRKPPLLVAQETFLLAQNFFKSTQTWHRGISPAFSQMGFVFLYRILQES